MNPQYRFFLTPRYKSEIEYLGASIGQCIDTGVVPTANTVIEIDFEMAYSLYNGIFGNYIDEAHRTNRLIFANNARTFYVNSYGRAGKASSITVPAAGRHTARVSHSSTTIDGVTISMSNYNGTANTTNIALFLANVATGQTSEYAKKIYSCKIYEGTTLIRDFVPYRVGTTGYMLDKVSGTLYANAGYQADFILGNDVEVPARPLWNNALSMQWNKESGYEFFRRSLSGELTFIGEDFDAITAASIETKYTVLMQITYDGATWADYWQGTFFKTDCKFSEGRVVVSPTSQDGYDEVVRGLDKEFDLVALAPEIHKVRYFKRPVLQLYTPGERVISNYVGGLWWEAECDAVSSGTSLVDDYKFAVAFTQLLYRVSGEMNLQMRSFNDAGYVFSQDEESGPGGDYWVTQLVRTADGARWYLESNPGDPQPPLPVILTPDTTTPAEGTVTFEQDTLNVYGRFLTDATSMLGYQTSLVPVDDMCDHGTYRRVIGYEGATSVFLWDGMSSTPTEWGLYQDGQYYTRPSLIGWGDMYPVGRSHWGNLSLWFSYARLGYPFDQEGRTEVWLNDAYPIWGVLSVLLSQLTNSVDFQNDALYSQILCGYDPIAGDSHRMFLTPKTNILKSGYDQPAHTAKITLRRVLDMLWQTMRLTWWIEGGKLRIEHISYLMNGGSYSGSPTVGIDLTANSVPRTGKTWATGQDNYSFNRPEMPQRYEFAWGDKVSAVFEGAPVDMVSRFVGDAIEKVTVEGFNSDIDYMLANPGACSQDGFALLDTVLISEGYVVPVPGAPIGIQNYQLSFDYLWQYYLDDLPCESYTRKGVTSRARGLKRYKTNEVKFPALTDPDIVKLIKTNIGEGQVEKLSVNLSSRAATATLNYDTD